MTRSDDAPLGIYPPPVRRAQQTATAVYAVLAEAGAATYDELAAEVGASRRAVEQAVAELRECGVVRSRPDPQHPNRKVHEPASD